MAEIVYKNLEAMLPEVEELERQGIFTKEELRIAIKRRTDFEYKLQKRTVCKQDILNYIEYETKFDRLLKKRMKRLKMKLLSTATITLTKRIHSLFDKALMKFSDDLNIWLQYIDFCKKTNARRAISKAFGKLLQKHAQNEEVWLLAAKHQVEEENNIEHARLLLQKALRQNKESQALWLEYFKLELLHVRKIKKRRDTLGIGGIDLKEDSKDQPKQMDIFLENKTAEIVYKNSLKQIPDNVEFRLKFLEVCNEFNDTENLQQRIMDSLKEDFSENEEVNSMFCTRCIQVSTDEVITDKQWKLKEKEMIGQYNEAVKRINTGRMWELYIESLAELLKESRSTEQTKRRFEYVKELIERVEKEGHLTVDMALFWIDLVVEVEENEEIISQIEKYLNFYPDEVSLWLKYMALKAQMSDSWEEIQTNFKVVFKKIQRKDDLPLWEMYVDIATDLEFKQCKAVFEEILDSPRKDLFDTFLPKYVDWLFVRKGVKACRKLYEKVSSRRLELPVLEKFIELEKGKETVDVKRIRQIYEKMVDDYGQENSDVWISYIDFEKKFNPMEVDASSMIYLKARNILKGSLNDEFITKYTLYNVQH